MFHHIQKNIVNSLGFHSSLRYSDLKPRELDGNVFGYHLKQLIRDDYIIKNDNGSYTLSPKGRESFIRRLEDETNSAHSIFLVVIKNGDNLLLRRRKAQPLLGTIGFIHGEPTPGVAIDEAAQLRVKKKTGLLVDLKVRTSALITQRQDGELVSYSHAVILYGETVDDIIISGDETGENFWSNDLLQDDTLPSCQDIIRLLETNQPWAELTYNL